MSIERAIYGGQLMFLGSFNKKLNFTESDYSEQNCGEKDAFNQNEYEKIAAEIGFYLGRREEYSAQEAYGYFHARYGAYPIDMRRFYDYYNTSATCFWNEKVLSDDRDIESISQYIDYFCYLRDGKYTDEHNITFVIDPNFVDVDGSKRSAAGRMTGRYLDNIIVAIGSFDDLNINSMKVLLGDSCQPIEYALEFFRRHSGSGAGILRHIAEMFRNRLSKLYPFPQCIHTSLENDEICLIHVYGEEEEHSFSVKFALSPSPCISFYGYSMEENFPLTAVGVENVIYWCNTAIECGNVLVAELDGREINRFEWLAPHICGVEELVSFYIEELSKSGKYAMSGTVLKYSNFLGEVFLSASI